MIPLLLDGGANVQLRDHDKNCPIELACEIKTNASFAISVMLFRYYQKHELQLPRKARAKFTLFSSLAKSDSVQALLRKPKATVSSSDNPQSRLKAEIYKDSQVDSGAHVLRFIETNHGTSIRRSSTVAHPPRTSVVGSRGASQSSSGAANKSNYRQSNVEERPSFIVRNAPTAGVGSNVQPGFSRESSPSTTPKYRTSMVEQQLGSKIRSLEKIYGGSPKSRPSRTNSMENLLSTPKSASSPKKDISEETAAALQRLSRPTVVNRRVDTSSTRTSFAVRKVEDPIITSEGRIERTSSTNALVISRGSVVFQASASTDELKSGGLNMPELKNPSVKDSDSPVGSPAASNKSTDGMKSISNSEDRQTHRKDRRSFDNGSFGGSTSKLLPSQMAKTGDDYHINYGGPSPQHVYSPNSNEWGRRSTLSKDQRPDALEIMYPPAKFMPILPSSGQYLDVILAVEQCCDCDSHNDMSLRHNLKKYTQFANEILFGAIKLIAERSYAVRLFAVKSKPPANRLGALEFSVGVCSGGKFV